jgi:ABC-type Fe3+/spermidine/putrescine transport system ATPase subunit
MGTVLELRGLSKHYPGQRAVDNLTLSVAPGEFFSLVGPSGCGKTTTLRLVAGFEEPTHGEILLAGRSLAGLPPYQRDVSTVFQSYALFPHLTVAQNVAFGLERRVGSSKSAIRKEVGDALALVQLSGKESRLPAQLSGGERQRTALARSLVLKPQVLLLDEPLSALDAKLRRHMRRYLKDLQRTVGIAFLFITHDQEEALSLSDRVGVMNQGRLEQVGPPSTLYQRPESRFVAEFLGDVNWFNEAGVRPQSLRVSRLAPSDSGHAAIGTVESTTFLGHCVQLAATLLNGSRCLVELPPQLCDFSIGETVHLSWNPADEFHMRSPQ